MRVFLSWSGNASRRRGWQAVRSLTEVSAKLAEMADRTKDVLEGYDERIKGHVDFTAEVVEKVEKNIVRGNEIILEELRNLENKLLAKIEGREK